MPYTWDPQRLWIKDDISTFTTLAAERSIGMSVVPVPEYTGVIPDISRPFLIKVRAILRIDVDDLPADGCVLLMCLADAGTAVRTMFDTDEMGLFPLAEIGNLDGEMSAYIEHEYDEHSPGTKQVYVGAHDNTSPGAFANPLTMTLMVAGSWGQTRMSGFVI